MFSWQRCLVIEILRHGSCSNWYKRHFSQLKKKTLSHSNRPPTQTLFELVTQSSSTRWPAAVQGSTNCLIYDKYSDDFSSAHRDKLHLHWNSCVLTMFFIHCGVVSFSNYPLLLALYLKTIDATFVIWSCFFFLSGMTSKQMTEHKIISGVILLPCFNAKWQFWRSGAETRNVSIL